MQFFRSIQVAAHGSLKDIFRGLQYRNYRYFFWGQSISLIGTWVQNIALSWLVYRLTGSALLLGTVVFALHIPSLFITPFAGVLADRWNRRKTIIATQLMAMIIAFVLSFLVLTDNISVGWIIFLAVLNGVFLAFDTPFRQAFVQEMVTRPSDLGNAIALNSTLYNLARFVGPPLGGVLITLVGEGWCFFLNGLSFFAVIAGLLSIKTKMIITSINKGSIIQQLVDGLRYAWRYRSLRFLLLLLILCSFFGLPFQALLPIFAADILGGGASMLGILTGSIGAGALLGALFLASQKSPRVIPVLTYRAALLFGIGLAVFSLSPFQPLSMIALAITGFGMIILFNATNTLLQSIADEDKRGRIVSLYSITFMGITPLGNLAAGATAETLGVPVTVFVFSIVCLAAALFFGKKVKLVLISLSRKNLHNETEKNR
ncbi:MAG TPA: MFS transporter [Bacteroidales bacterium]|nr:MFS transporter [Bacteroidales bacterium]